MRLLSFFCFWPLVVVVFCLDTTCQSKRRELPRSRLHIAYATDRSLREKKVVEACCDHGVNVVVWSFCHLEVKGETLGVNPTFSVNEVAEVRRAIEEAGVKTTHLVSFGGWNGPHPTTTASGERWFRAWERWNDELGGLFDGVDWDLEGHDDPTATTAQMTFDLLNLVCEFTTLARQQGYIVGVAPPQSYLDVYESRFDLALNHEPSSPWGFPFPYAGRNAYASLIDQCDFDFVSVQFYEGYSRANFQINRQQISPIDYLIDVANRFDEGFDLQFSDTEMKKTVRIPPGRLVFGFANGWADNEKFIFIEPSDIAHAFKRLGKQQPRGTMFWVLDEDGVTHTEKRPLFFAKELTEAFNRIAPSSPDSES